MYKPGKLRFFLLFSWFFIVCAILQGFSNFGWPKLKNLSYKSNRYVGIIVGLEKKHH
jgi:hypothetical protein